MMRYFRWAMVLVLLASMGARAQVPPPPPAGSLERADFLVRWGAWSDAEAAYRTLLAATTDPSRRLKIALRRLGIAELTEDQAQTHRLADAIVAMPGAAQSVETQMQVAVARGTVAWRAGDVAAARHEFDKALAAANRVDVPGARLARFECQTFKYFEQLAQQGRPDPSAYQAAFLSAFAPLSGYPLTLPLEPMVEARAGQWSRRWIQAAIFYSAAAYAANDADASMKWYHEADDLATGGRGVLTARAVQARDPEAGFAAVECGLDMAEGFPAVPDVANRWLGMVEKEAALDDGLLDGLSAWLGSTPDWTEQGWIRARIHGAHAAVLAFQSGYAASSELGQQAIRESEAAIAGFDHCGRWLTAVDARILLAAFQLSSEGAGAMLGQALERSRALEYPLGVLRASYWIGKRLADAGNLAGAETALRECVTQTDLLIEGWGPVDEGRHQALQNTHLIYELLIDVLRRENKNDDALQMMSRLSQQTQLGNVDLARVQARNPQVRQALQKASELQTNLHDLQLQASTTIAGGGPPQLKGQIASNRSQFYQALNTIHQLEPDYDRLVSVRPTSYARLQPHLPADTLLLQYLPGVDRLYIFIITREQLAIKVVDVPRAQLEHDIVVLRHAVSAAPRHAGVTLDENAAAADARLYQALIAPAADELKQKSMLAVVPSGSLFYVPFAALGPAGPQGIDYLARHAAVVMLSSLEILDLMEAHPASTRGGRLFAIGNPDGSLPGAQEEVKDLAALFKNPEVFVQSAATKETLGHISKDTSIVHFATHGMLNPDDANESYLVMAGAGDVGRLKTAEIYGLDFKGVSLVTLSACKTALSWSQPGADVSTLAQAFSVAGTHSMLASLWSVSDVETRTLMVNFYKNLLSGKSKAQALQLAQQALLARPDTAAPFYWAAFELIGDWR